MKKFAILSILSLALLATASFANSPYPALQRPLLETPAPTTLGFFGGGGASGEHPIWKGASVGLGFGVPGFAFNLGYRFPKSESLLKNRVGFRLNINTVSPIWGMFSDAVNEAGQDVLDEDFGNDPYDPNPSDLAITGAKFNADVSSFHLGALVDFHPFGYLFGLGGFRVSAGYYFGSTSVEAKISGYEIQLNQAFADKIRLEDNYSNTYEDVPVTVDVTGSIEGLSPLKMGISLNTKGPYLGAGWDFGLLFGLHLTFDAGVVFTQAHYVSLDIPEIKFNDIKDPQVTLTYLGNPQSADGQAQINLLLEDLEKSDYSSYCNAQCMDRARNTGVIEVPEDFIEKFKEEYGEKIDELNTSVQNEKNKMLNGKKDKNDPDSSDGVNTVLKDYGYFPIIRFGLMFRF